MAIQFVPGQVAVRDPNPGGPQFLVAKDLQVKAVKLSSGKLWPLCCKHPCSCLPC